MRGCPLEARAFSSVHLSLKFKKLKVAWTTDKVGSVLDGRMSEGTETLLPEI